MILYFKATMCGKLVSESNLHCKDMIPFELDKYYFLRDDLTVAQRKFLEKVLCEDFETRFNEFDCFIFVEYIFREI